MLVEAWSFASMYSACDFTLLVSLTGIGQSVLLVSS